MKVRIALPAAADPTDYLAGEGCALTADGRTVVEVDLESYVRLVVPGEIGGDMPPEALSAQAVATRSWSLTAMGKHRADGYDLCASAACCQLCSPVTAETPDSRAACENTAGCVAVDAAGKPLVTQYHACCGGLTADGVVDGPPATRILKQAPNEQALHVALNINRRAFCSESRAYSARYFRWRRACALPDGRQPADVLVRRNDAGRTWQVELIWADGEQHKLRGAMEIRRIFGLPSAMFWMVRADGGLQFEGGGHGHGCGMCQAGAVGMAQAGHDYMQILRHYFPGMNNCVRLEG